MYAGNLSNKDTLHVSPHIAAHRSSSPGPLSAHIPTYRVGTQSVLNLKSMDLQSSQGIPCSSDDFTSHHLKNAPQDLSAHSTSHLPERGSISVGMVTSASTHYQKSLPHIHTVVSQGMSSTQLLPAHITERNSYYRVSDSVIGIQGPSAILVSTNDDSHLPVSQSNQTTVIGHNGDTDPNLGIVSTNGTLPSPLPAHSSSSSNGNTMQLNPGTIFKLGKNPQHLEHLTTMTSHTPPPQQDHQQLQQQQQPHQQAQSHHQESHQHQQQQEQQHQRQHHQHQHQTQHGQQSHQQQQIPHQQSEHHQQQVEQQLSSFTPPQRSDLVQQALRAVVSNPNQTGNDKEVIEYNYSAGDIAELLMMNIQVSASLQASIKQTGTSIPVPGVTTGSLSDINNESQVVVLQPAAIDETNCLQPQLPVMKTKQKHKLSEEAQHDKKIKIAERMRNKRADENNDVKSVRRMREAERMRRKRAGENEETKVKRRIEAASRARTRRATMSDEERVVDRKRAAERMRLRRKTEDDQQKAIRRMKAAERMRKRRALETPEQRAARRANIAEKMKTRRKIKPDEDITEDGSVNTLTRPEVAQSDSEARGETLVKLPEVTIERSSVQRAQLERTQQLLRSQDIERPQIQQRIIHPHTENPISNNDLKIELQQHKFDVQTQYKIEGLKIENLNKSRIIVPTNLVPSSGLTLVHINDYPINNTSTALSTVDLPQLTGQSLSLNNKTHISDQEIRQLSEQQIQLNTKILSSHQELQQQQQLTGQPLSLDTKSLSSQELSQMSGQTFSVLSGNSKTMSSYQELSNLSGHHMPVNTKAVLYQESTQSLSPPILSDSKTLTPIDHNEQLSPISRQPDIAKSLSPNHQLCQSEQPISQNSKTISSIHEITQICGQTLAGNLKSFSSNSELLHLGQPLILNAKSLSSIQGIAQFSGQQVLISAKNLTSNQETVQTEQPIYINAKSLLSNQSLGPGQPITFTAKSSLNNQRSTAQSQPLSLNMKTLSYGHISSQPGTNAKVFLSNEEFSHSSRPVSLNARILSKQEISHCQPSSLNTKRVISAETNPRQEIQEPLSLQKYQQGKQTQVLKSVSPTSNANSSTSGGISIATTAPSTIEPLELCFTKNHNSTFINHHHSLPHVLNFQQQQQLSQLHVQQRHQQT